MIASRIAAALFLLTAAEPASAFIPAGKCAVVVASRATLPEVFAYMQDNQRLPFTQVFAARNGWYAISVGLTDDKGSADALAWRKGRSEIPADSYCSTGEAYVREVWSAQAAAPGFASTDPSADFDARPLVREEKRFLQAALALKGHYNGRLDGSWGQGSQSALESWTRSEFKGEPTNGLAALAAVIALEELADGGWRPVWIGEYEVTVLLPVPRMVSNEENGRYIGFSDSLSDLRFSLGRVTYEGVVALHAKSQADHRQSSSPYVVRQTDLWITSADKGTFTTYVRSDRQAAGWLSMVTMWPRGTNAEGEAALIVASYQTGRGDALIVPPNGHLESMIVALADAVDKPGPQALSTEGEAAPAASSSVPSPDQGTGSSTGTGFFVNATGQVITNAHVVTDCRSIRVFGTEATILISEPSMDLAILQTSAPRPEGGWLPFSAGLAGLNADVTVAGYPLPDILGGLNITRGSISSLQGMGNDATRMQITAPVQPGNSGGPIVDRFGRVVGVVVAKLDSVRVADAIGDIPQNVNFGIRGAMAQLLANANQVEITVSEADEPLDPEELAQRLGAATVLIECE